MAPPLSRSAIPRVAPFAVFIAFIAIQSFLDGDLRWMTVARGLVVAVLLGIFWRSYVELRDPYPHPGPLPKERESPAREYLIAVAVGLAVFVAWINLDHGWMVFAGGPGFDPRDAAGRIDWALAGLRLFALAAVVPVMEELFWRSFLLRWIDARDFIGMDPRRVSARAFALSCALFAAEHSFWFAGLLAGAAYTWLYVRSGNLWLPVLSHAITNGTLGIWILATQNWRYW